MATKKARKDRSDITVGAMEEKHGMPPGTVRNEDGRDTRSDKKLGTIRNGVAKKSSKNGVTPKQAVARATTARGSAGSDLSQKDSAKRTTTGKAIDTNRRYTKKELEAMPTEELTLLAFRMTYDRVHGKRKLVE